MKTVRRLGEPSRPGSAVVSKGCPRPGAQAHSSAFRSSAFPMARCPRNQTNPTYKRNVKSHRIHIKLLERLRPFISGCPSCCWHIHQMSQLRCPKLCQEEHAASRRVRMRLVKGWPLERDNGFSFQGEVSVTGILTGQQLNTNGIQDLTSFCFPNK